MKRITTIIMAAAAAVNAATLDLTGDGWRLDGVGETAGVTSNRFMRYDFDVKRLLKPGRNTISGFFRSAEAVAMELAGRMSGFEPTKENRKHENKHH